MESVTRGLSHHYDFYVNENAGTCVILSVIFLYKL